jgi:hypothetical protein
LPRGLSISPPAASSTTMITRFKKKHYPWSDLTNKHSSANLIMSQ